MTAAALMTTIVLPLQTAYGQQGVKRSGLQQHDLSIPGREAVQLRVDFAPGVLAPKHTQLFVPYGVPHSAKNVGTVNAAELATYTVEKGKPLVTLAR
jgi:hypothetical protein